jgi:acyl CoA:acetate/3-ketoacid CoA transferase
MVKQILEPVSRSWTPVIVEAAAFHDGIVMIQVNQIVDKLPRVDIPASWVDLVVMTNDK